MRALLLGLAFASAPACQEGSRSPETQSTFRRIDLNRATQKELEELPHIGEKLARSIIASRNARGGRFQSLEQLLDIDGIGKKTLDDLRPYLYVR